MNAAASIKNWLGLVRRDEDEITLGAVRRLATTLDRDPAALQRGDDLIVLRRLLSVKGQSTRP